jgi:thymidine phosphorylase
MSTVLGDVVAADGLTVAQRRSAAVGVRHGTFVLLAVVPSGNFRATASARHDLLIQPH